MTPLGPKKKTLTDKQKAFLAALGGEAKGNIRAAMRIAGYEDTTRQHEVINPLADEIMEIANRLIAANAVKAAYSMTDLLDTPTTPGAKEIVLVAKDLLDRAGVVKKQQGEATIKADNVFILPQKDGEVKVEREEDE